jgi:hypothetical protein
VQEFIGAPQLNYEIGVDGSPSGACTVRSYLPGGRKHASVSGTPRTRSTAFHTDSLLTASVCELVNSRVVADTNLRQPVALTKVSFPRWNHNRCLDTERFSFTANAVDLDDPRRI